jgi:hypothetical protein
MLVLNFGKENKKGTGRNDFGGDALRVEEGIEEGLAWSGLTNRGSKKSSIV